MVQDHPERQEEAQPGEGRKMLRGRGGADGHTGSDLGYGSDDPF
jgi:hypothetical protein